MKAQAPRASLSAWLDGLGPALLRLESLDTRYEVTALQHVLDAAGRYPVVRVDRPRLADGSEIVD
jgi:hypothetical protein